MFLFADEPEGLTFKPGSQVRVNVTASGYQDSDADVLVLPFRTRDTTIVLKKQEP